jgi:hypothetical protein
VFNPIDAAAAAPTDQMPNREELVEVAVHREVVQVSRTRNSPRKNVSQDLPIARRSPRNQRLPTVRLLNSPKLLQKWVVKNEAALGRLANDAPVPESPRDAHAVKKWELSGFCRNRSAFRSPWRRISDEKLEQK